MKRTKRKKSNRQVQLRWRWRCPWPAPLWLQNLLQVVYHVLYPYTYFCPSFFCFCAAYKRFLPVVVFVSPHFFRFFFSLHFCVHLQDFFPYFCQGAARAAMCVCLCVCGCLGCVLCHWNAAKHLSCPSCSQSLCLLLLLLLTEGDWLPLHINITLLARSAHCNLFRLTRATMAAPATATAQLQLQLQLQL